MSEASEPQPDPVPPPHGGWRNWAIIGGLLALVGGPVLVLEAPREISRWQLAAALEHHAQGDASGAAERVDAALHWDEANAAALRQRIAWKFAAADYRAVLADCDRLLALDAADHAALLWRLEAHQRLGDEAAADKDEARIQELAAVGKGAQRRITLWFLQQAARQRAAGEEQAAYAWLDRVEELLGPSDLLLLQRARWKTEDQEYEAALADCDALLAADSLDVAALVQRSIICQHLRRHEAAIDAWKTIDQLAQQAQGATRPSSLNGLAYARAVANRDLDEALREIEQAMELARPSFLPGEDNPALLDTRGFIHYLRGDLDQALADLDPAVTQVEEDLRRKRPTLELRQMLEATDPQEELREAQQSAAVIRYHRGLVHQKLGNKEAAERDFARVRQLGFEPGPQLF